MFTVVVVALTSLALGFVIAFPIALDRRPRLKVFDLSSDLDKAVQQDCDAWEAMARNSARILKEEKGIELSEEDIQKNARHMREWRG